jgi:uncharacterized protein YxjI
MAGMNALVTGRDRILIQQIKEWGEILLGFESRNKFELRDEHGQPLGFAAEEAGGIGRMFLRNLFGRCRAATIHVYSPDGEEIGRGQKPFRWYFHRMEISEGGRRLGAIQRRFSLLHRIFSVENDAGEEVLRIESPFFRIWTFKLMFRGQEVGVITKKWRGLLGEMFTDADTFGVEWTKHVPDDVRKLLLVATFLIDFTCFENNVGSGVLWDAPVGD